MSLFKKRKESAPATPQFADDDPNSPLRVSGNKLLLIIIKLLIILDKDHHTINLIFNRF